MKQGTLKADILLLMTATIWGFAFVAQRVGMDYVGPFTFNGVRFALGSLSLLPLILLLGKRQSQPKGIERIPVFKGALLAGLALFAGSSLQQAGLVYTTAGNAGFITGLYVVLVPIVGLFWRQRPRVGTWIGAMLAVVGLYFLSVTSDFTISFGDFLVLLAAFFWAGHVLLIGWLAPRTDPLKLASAQFAVCAALSLLTALAVEQVSLQGILDATVPILYGGLGSVGIAYTLQVIAQRDAHPAHSAIIMSLEGVFAALGGWWLLGEILTLRGLFGCGLMLAGMIVSELSVFFGQKKPDAAGELSPVGE
ncbi:threonine/homoserine efflux transporter RhtA [Geothermobacter ehrlichii]|uniref:Threonine/homoserine efflux transporter RhtA n=1 Tax=Geothermobacter ehrlichii TaxID=213224 RepID=A0A5D3WKY8_9BACT|nr:DMT family transporter [Geothermobacter ehrlichii]TYO99062.1 threonine/homoserine efflux transporter RhtA [Geothermobacter ehrlichii]